MDRYDYLSIEEILNLHRAVIDDFGGTHGILNYASLESAAALPKTNVFGKERYPNAAAKAAAYCFYFVSNHAFVDGNKRIGLLCAIRFLRKNNVEINFGEDTVSDLIISIARNESAIEDVIEFFESNTSQGNQ